MTGPTREAATERAPKCYCWTTFPAVSSDCPQHGKKAALSAPRPVGGTLDQGETVEGYVMHHWTCPSTHDTGLPCNCAYPRILAALTSSGGGGTAGEQVATEELGEWMRVVREAIWYARVTAQSHGYALAVHGSLRRDIDAVAVPWTDKACSPDELAEHITTFLGQLEVGYEDGWKAASKTREEKPHGRIAWSIPLKGLPSLTSRGQCAPYLDLSVYPALSGARVPEGGEAQGSGVECGLPAIAQRPEGRSVGDDGALLSTTGLDTRRAAVPAAPAPAAGSEVWAIIYEDPDRPMETFVRAGAEAAARARYAQATVQWNCHLLCTASPAPTAASGAEMPEVTAEDVEVAQYWVSETFGAMKERYLRILALCEYALAHQPPSAGPTGDDHA